MAQVMLILRESVPSLGEAGDLVRVKPGFARNYLIPQGKATFATEANVREVEHHRRIIAEKVAKLRTDQEREKQRIEAVSLRVAARVGEEGKLFGSVTASQIADLLAEKGFEIDRRKIELAEPLKEAGEHRVPLKLHRDVVAEIKIEIVPEE